MAKLRDYQVEAIRMLNDSIRAGNKRIIVAIPTGGGKSTVFSSYTKLCVKHGKKVLFMVHSKELVQQFANRLSSQFNLGSGIIMSGIKPNLNKDVQVASVQTLVNRNKPDADLVVIDECHRAKAKTYQKILDFYPDAIIVGLTATPFRADGKPLGDIFEDIVRPIKIRELVEKGYLVGTKVIAPKESVDMTGVKTVAGEFHKGQMQAKFEDGAVTRGVVKNYLERAKGKRAIVFNCSVEHSKEMHDRFVQSGVKSAHIDGETDKKQRAKIVQDFAEGRVEVLNSIDIFTEGFDIPATEVVILNRATKSEGLYVQMVGRGLRPAEGKDECLVLDHGGNTLRFGYVEDYDQGYFSLDGKKKSSGKGMPCKKCIVGIMKYKPATEEFVCPNCGHSYKANKKKKRKFSEECEFEVLDRDAVMIQRIVNLPNWKAKDKLPLSQLRLYQAVKGYKKGWVFHAALAHFDDITEHTPDVWKIINYRLKMAELEANTYHLYQDIKKQADEKRIQGEKRKTVHSERFF